MPAVIGTDVDHASDLLQRGEVVGIPTETVYGLAADAFNESAVLRIFEVKQRPSFDPLILHIGSAQRIASVAREVSPEAVALMEAFWPGPLTLILPKHPSVPDLVTSGSDRVGVRMPSHPLTRELLEQTGFPLAAPSANPFGYVSPTTAQHVADQLGDLIPYILDGGPCSVGIESSIVGLVPATNGEKERWTLMRPGGVPVEAMEAIIGPLERIQGHGRTMAPGMMESHYSPGKPTYVGDVPALLERYASQRIGVISFTRRYAVHRCEVLSPFGDVKEAARGLFAAMRSLDRSDCEVILAEEFPDTGLGPAINDRLRRASAKGLGHRLA